LFPYRDGFEAQFKAFKSTGTRFERLETAQELGIAIYWELGSTIKDFDLSHWTRFLTVPY